MSALFPRASRPESALLNSPSSTPHRGLQVVGITLDDDGEMILVRRFPTKHRPVLPNYRKRPGKKEEFINAVNPRCSGAIPASFFYAADGRQIGNLVDEAGREKYEVAIRTLLAASKPASARPTASRCPQFSTRSKHGRKRENEISSDRPADS